MLKTDAACSLYLHNESAKRGNRFRLLKHYSTIALLFFQTTAPVTPKAATATSVIGMALKSPVLGVAYVTLLSEDEELLEELLSEDEELLEEPVSTWAISSPALPDTGTNTNLLKLDTVNVSLPSRSAVASPRSSTFPS